MKKWPAGVNSRSTKVTENDILRTQDITTDNDTLYKESLEIRNESFQR